MAYFEECCSPLYLSMSRFTFRNKLIQDGLLSTCMSLPLPRDMEEVFRPELGAFSDVG